MSRNEVRKYFDILELPKEATLSEVRSAYLQLKELYTRDSIVLSPLIDEFSEETKVNILDQIEDAYRSLVEYLENEDDEQKNAEEKMSGEEELIRKEIEDITEYTGMVLKEIREKLRIGLYEITLSTNIRMGYLEDIESEKFDALPPEVYLRGFVSDYARYLGLDQKKVAEDYLARYRQRRMGKG